VRPHYEWFDQADPGGAAGSATGTAGAAVFSAAGERAAATLRIGDIALRREALPGTTVYDLGAEWWSWTGLPFAFAVWQVRRDADPAEVRRLAGLLRESRAWFGENAGSLAVRYAPAFGLTSDRLLQYWHSLRFDLDQPMQQGL